MKRIPLRDRAGQVIAHALIDDADLWRVLAHTWHLAGAGYVVRNLGRGHSEYLHRFLMELVPGDGKKVDHVDGDPLNNQRRNLRVCTHAENHQNQGSRHGTSRFRGVHRRPSGRWCARVTIAGQQHHLGMFDTEEQAAAVAGAFRAAHMPFSSDARSAALDDHQFVMKDDQKEIAA